LPHFGHPSGIDIPLKQGGHGENHNPVDRCRPIDGRLPSGSATGFSSATLKNPQSCAFGATAARAPSHPFRFWRQVTIIRIAIAEQSRLDLFLAGVGAIR
jgi:hypothetical protein